MEMRYQFKVDLNKPEFMRNALMVYAGFSIIGDGYCSFYKKKLTLFDPWFKPNSPIILLLLRSVCVYDMDYSK